MISQKVNSCGTKIMPSYQKVFTAKDDCRPARETVEISGSRARAEIRPLLQKTLERAVLSQNDVIDEKFGAAIRKNCLFTCAMGFDSSTGNSLWHHTFEDAQHLNVVKNTDHSVIFACLNPIKLTCEDDGCVLWENPSPCSNRLVSPILIQYEQETAAFTAEYVHHMHNFKMLF